MDHLAISSRKNLAVFRLQSRTFARTLSLREQHVTDIGLERQLDTVLQSLSRFLTERVAEPDQLLAADL